MTKNIWILLIVGIIFYSCKDKKEEPVVKHDSTGVVLSNIKEVKTDEGIKLVYFLKKGEKHEFKIYSYSRNEEILQIDSIMSNWMSQELNYTLSTNVTDVDEEGNVEIEIKCNRITAKGQSSMGDKIEYDSNNPPKDSVKRASFFNQELLISAPFSVRISKIGELLDIFKFDKMVKKVLEKYPNATNEEKNYIRESIKDGMLKSLVQQMFKNLTDKELKVNSTWSVSFPGKLSVFDIQNTATYKLKRIVTDENSKYADITSSLDVTYSGKTEYNEKGVNYKFNKPTATGTGYILFDLDRKLIKKSESNITLEMVMDFRESKAGGKTGKKTDKVVTKSVVSLIN